MWDVRYINLAIITIIIINNTYTYHLKNSYDLDIYIFTLNRTANEWEHQHLN